MIFDKPLKDIQLSDIQSLVDNSVAEGREIDYKENFAIGSDDEKREFLADISSFSNCIGGYLIFGLSEKRKDGQKTGFADQIVGLKNFNEESDIAKILSVIRDGIDPRIPGIETRVLDTQDKKVLVIKIPKRFEGLHLVIFKNWTKFFSRTSIGKYQLDVREIKDGFIESSALSERIRTFQRDRIVRITTSDSPVLLEPGPKFVFHIIPVLTFEGREQIDLPSLQTKVSVLKPWGTTGWTGRYNLDGYVVHPGSKIDDEKVAYIQIFRNGCVEIAISYSRNLQGKTPYIPSIAYEKIAVEEFKHSVAFFDGIGLSPPILFFPTLVDVDGVTFQAKNEWDTSSIPLRNKVIFLPDVSVENYQQEVSATLKPAFDVLWQAGGFPQSSSFKNGNWEPPSIF